jgi:hypothetical protein
MKIWFGFIFGIYAISHWSTKAAAWELKAETMGERLGAVFWSYYLSLYFAVHL